MRFSIRLLALSLFQTGYTVAFVPGNAINDRFQHATSLQSTDNDYIGSADGVSTTSNSGLPSLSNNPFESSRGDYFDSVPERTMARTGGPPERNYPSAYSTGDLAGVSGGAPRNARETWSDLDTINVQGGALRTWSLTDPYVERVQVFLRTDGRPLNANVELWQGPDNTPQKMSLYLEDGGLRPFNAIIETPFESNAIAIRNTGYLEFPMLAAVEAYVEGDKIANVRGEMKLVQGGAVHTTPFAPSVQSVHVVIRTDERPLNARIELLQGPNNSKQVIEFYSENGSTRPFNAIIETPGVGNVIRVLNTATVEFPLYCIMKPYVVDSTIGNRNFFN